MDLGENLMYTKSKLRDISFSTVKYFNKTNHKFENYSEEEYSAFFELFALNNVVIQKADQGNMVVLVYLDVYRDKMRLILMILAN